MISRAIYMTLLLTMSLEEIMINLGEQIQRHQSGKATLYGREFTGYAYFLPGAAGTASLVLPFCFICILYSFIVQ
jgi:hypothetical protein